jgi:hypothetical protein
VLHWLARTGLLVDALHHRDAGIEQRDAAGDRKRGGGDAQQAEERLADPHRGQSEDRDIDEEADGEPQLVASGKASDDRQIGGKRGERAVEREERHEHQERAVGR